MKRAAPKQTPKNAAKNPRWRGEARAFDAKGLRASVELLRELLAEVDAISVRMDERKIDALTLPAGFGAGSYEAAKDRLKSWIKGLHEALYERIENPDTPVGGDDA